MTSNFFGSKRKQEVKWIPDHKIFQYAYLQKKYKKFQRRKLEQKSTTISILRKFIFYETPHQTIMYAMEQELVERKVPNVWYDGWMMKVKGVL